MKNTKIASAVLLAAAAMTALAHSPQQPLRRVAEPRRPRPNKPSHTGYRHNLTLEQHKWNFEVEKKKAERHARRLAERYPDHKSL